MLDKDPSHAQEGGATETADRMGDAMSSTAFVPGQETTRAFRDALGCYATGVTVITAMTADGPLAMTANSFAAVSLDPALVLWCPARKSARHDVFCSVPHYSIQVMAHDQQALAVQFARSGTDFGGVDWVAAPNGAPILPGVLARFDCARRAVHDGGDHSVVIGEVQLADYRAGSGLIFKRGQYGGFAGLT